MRAKASVWTPHNANFMHDSSSGHICMPPSSLWFPLFLAYVYNLWQRCRDWVICLFFIVRYKNSFFPHSRKESLPFSHKQISFRKMTELFILINNEVDCKSSTNLRISLWTEGTDEPSTMSCADIWTAVCDYRPDYLLRFFLPRLCLIIQFDFCWFICLLVSSLATQLQAWESENRSCLISFIDLKPKQNIKIQTLSQ